MIVVVGSRHDPVAVDLAARWPEAGLCSAEDLTSAGWVWPSGPGPRRWVVAGQAVTDADISGVFLRRASVLPEELANIHPDDRAYLAAEAHAFLVLVLATTAARVVPAVVDAGLGDETVRLERWIPAAAEAGLTVAPIRLTTEPVRSRRGAPTRRLVEVVDGVSTGDASDRCRRGAVAMASALDLVWATFLFDGRGRLVTVTTRAAPGVAASAALATALGPVVQ